MPEKLTIVSKVGANYLRKIFLHPTQDIDVIMDRLNTIEFFVDPINGSVKDNLNQHLKNIKGVNALFNRLMTESFSVKDIKILCDNLLNAMRIRDIIVGQNSYLKIFQQIYDSFTEEMQYLANMITKIVDLNKSLRTETFEINYGIDVELDFAKDLYSQLSPILNKVAESETNTYGHFLRDIHCLYIPQIGFLTSAEHFASESESSSHSDDLQVVVTAGQRIYYKTFTTIELDQHFGDIHSEIIDRQILIINRLQQYIANYRHLFNTIEKYCAKLDALIAMSQIAVNYRYCKPNITTDGVIEIRDGRHPLIELMSKTFVPNDYYSGGQHKKVKIISGPNACGKSVYLKQICLIVFMAHIGSYVPALSANIPIVDRIFTRLHTPESMSMRLSTFMLDLNQMSNASKYTTKRSLVVVDEFGKGTQSVDGLALMAACLNQ
ncbi:unnamed protein product [Medioppia subpectinata]|uniref:DNA mismatch repair proteins mutS family domain-containing protein n=1 Tax=Medioppia subpectinata TaxID=1979941 RepID=A0A7R9KN76_9ACAR|nr:unnamed protein product [Medioppia subpectinata]CAG2106689.1 unnamed protein product [Medioppia subpectinata]